MEENKQNKNWRDVVAFLLRENNDSDSSSIFADFKTRVVGYVYYKFEILTFSAGWKICIRYRVISE